MSAGLGPRGRARRWLVRWPRLFVRLFPPDDQELGLLGEEIAARSYRARGYRILARRLRTIDGEADLLVASGATLAVVEVKTARMHPAPRPREAARIGAPALRWRPGFRCDARRLRRLRSLRRSLSADRVDLVEVFFLESSRRFRVLLHEDLRHVPTRGGFEGSPGDLR